MTGRHLCYHHGGKTPNGHALPQTTHGRYSKYLPARLADKYLEATNDADLLNLGSEIALIDSRIAEQLGRVGNDAIGHIWAKIRQVNKDLKVAISTKDGSLMAQLLQELDELSRQGNADYMGWRDIVGLVDMRRKLVESERKRYVDMQQNITAKEAMLLIGAIIGIIRDNVQDRQTLAAIQADVGKLIAIHSI